MYPDPTRPWIEAVVEYHANPLETRTIQQFCDELGIHRDTYYKYMQKNREAIYREADRRRKGYMSEMRAKAYKALTYRLSKSDKALQMFFEMAGDYIPKSQQTVEYTTPEQKRDKIKRLLDQVLKKKENE